MSFRFDDSDSSTLRGDSDDESTQLWVNTQIQAPIERGIIGTVLLYLSIIPFMLAATAFLFLRESFRFTFHLSLDADPDMARDACWCYFWVDTVCLFIFGLLDIIRKLATSNTSTTRRSSHTKLICVTFYMLRACLRYQYFVRVLNSGHQAASVFFIFDISHHIQYVCLLSILYNLYRLIKKVFTSIVNATRFTDFD